ncbi:MAG: hypothetical protein ACTTGJ_00240 [Clostridium sp.]
MNEDKKQEEKTISQKINVTEIQILANKPNAMYINGLLEAKEDKIELSFVSIDKKYMEKISILKTKSNKENEKNIYYFDIDLKNIDMEKSYYLELDNNMLKIPNQTYKGKLFNLYITDNVFYIHSNISTIDTESTNLNNNNNNDITTNNSSNINGVNNSLNNNIKKSKKEIRKENRRKNKLNRNNKKHINKKNREQKIDINTKCVQNVDNFFQNQIKIDNEIKEVKKIKEVKELKEKISSEKIDDTGNIKYKTEIQSIGILNSKDKGEYIWFELSINKYINETLEFLDIRKIKVYLESSDITECISDAENINKEVYQNEKFKIQNSKKHYGYIRKNLDGLYYFDFKISDICNYICKYILYIEIEGNTREIKLPKTTVINENIEINDGKIQIKKINNIVPKVNPINNISYLKYNISFLDVQKINGLEKLIGNIVISKVIKGKEELLKYIPKMYIVSLDEKYVYELKLIKSSNNLNIYYFELNLEGKPRTKYILKCILEEEEYVKDKELLKESINNNIINSCSDKYIQLKNLSISIKGEELEII